MEAMGGIRGSTCPDVKACADDFIVGDAYEVTVLVDGDPTTLIPAWSRCFAMQSPVSISTPTSEI
jgi:hypothetical protein